MSASTCNARNGPTYNEPNDRQAMTDRWWRDRYHDIGKQGYRLCPRYHPRRSFFSAEDGQATMLRAEVDASRIQDRRPVVLKKVSPQEGPHELRIGQQFSSPEHSSKPDNHCAPLLGVIELSGRFGPQKLMVFPLLYPYNRPRIRTFGEFVAFFTQICEGIRFMHQRNVAHRDCTANNIKRTAGQRPHLYYFVDFSLSRQYPSRDAMDEPLPGRDGSAPEHQSRPLRVCNPFHTDIYYIGNVIRKEFMENCDGFEFMEDLIASMTQEDPALRPLIEDVLQELSRIQASISKSKLRSAIISKNAPKILRIIRQAGQSVRNLWYILGRQP